jgi:hypothetical protein
MFTTTTANSGNCFRAWEADSPKKIDPAAGVEYYYYDQLGSAYSDQPDEPELWDLPRFVEEVFTTSRNRERKASLFLLLMTDFMKNRRGWPFCRRLLAHVAPSIRLHLSDALHWCLGSQIGISDWLIERPYRESLIKIRISWRVGRFFHRSPLPTMNRLWIGR